MTNLIDYANTDIEREAVEAFVRLGSISAAAREIGKNRSGIRNAIDRVRTRAGKQGYAPEQDMNHPSIPGFGLKRASTNYDGEGNINQQWVIQEPDKQAAMEAVLAAIENVAVNVKPLAKIKPPKSVEKDLCTVYTITDFHLGMYAWSEEAGDDWDLAIAEHTLVKAMAGMIQGSPASHTGVFLQLGDFLHWDGLAAVTPQSKHLLDADTRYSKLAELALKVTVQCIAMLAEKHKEVKVFTCEGNHDIAGSVWLRKALKMYYEKNPRVDVDDTEFPYYAFLWGKTLIGAHHGHHTKIKGLPALFASEPRFRKLWGAAEYTYIHTGHYHHVDVKPSEHGGAIIERHPTLSARDAYAARGGYTSFRAAKAITYHKERGEDSRKVVVP